MPGGVPRVGATKGPRSAAGGRRRPAGRPDHRRSHRDQGRTLVRPKAPGGARARMPYLASSPSNAKTPLASLSGGSARGVLLAGPIHGQGCGSPRFATPNRAVGALGARSPAEGLHVSSGRNVRGSLVPSSRDAPTVCRGPTRPPWAGCQPLSARDLRGAGQRHSRGPGSHGQRTAHASGLADAPPLVQPQHGPRAANSSPLEYSRI